MNTIISRPFKALLVIITISISVFSQENVEKSSFNIENKNSSYKWSNPVLQIVDLDSIAVKKNDYENYLTSIDILEQKLDNNTKELKMLTNEANDEVKVLKNERKYNAEKRKFAKEDEKLLKSEQKLRAIEQKQLSVERKELKKISKELGRDELYQRNLVLDDKASKLKLQEDNWNRRRDDLKFNLSTIAETEKKLDRREVEVQNRLRELGRLKDDNSLKLKKIDIEKKKAKQELKKSKELLKTNIN